MIPPSHVQRCHMEKHSFVKKSIKVLSCSLRRLGTSFSEDDRKSLLLSECNL